MPGIPSGKRQLDMADLDSVGNNDRGDNVKLTNTAAVLVRMADVLISDYKRRMASGGHTASGRGADKVYAKDVVIDGSKVSLDIMVPEYLMFQNYGVKGLKGGDGKYAFKKGFPSRKMRASILQWIRTRGMRVDKYSPLENKLSKKSMTKDRAIKKMRDKSKDYDALSFAVSKSIMNKGIKATKDFDNAIMTMQKKFKKEIKEGLKLDIINNF